MEKKQGLLVVISAPSGCGKGTVIRRLFELNPSFHYSISVTTRDPRPGEVDGREYHFKSKEEFLRMVSENGILEYAEYIGNFYGTPRAAVEQKLSSGTDVVLEIEVQGAAAVKRTFPNAVTIFLMPPSMEELNRRLTGRGTEPTDIIASRVLRAKEEMPHAKEYEYIVINDKVDEAARDILAIIRGEKLKYEAMKDFVSEVLK